MPNIKIQKEIQIHQPLINQEARTKEAAKMYEHYFLNEMVKAMRQTVDHSRLTEPNMAEKIYSEQLDGQYVDKWANSGGVGLADIIYNQIQDRFFSNGAAAPRPQGPLPISPQKNTTIKIDETKSQGIPVIRPQSTLPKNEVSFLYEWNLHNNEQPRDVMNPYAGEVLQLFRVGDDRQILKLAHDNGLTSTISFLGQTKDINLGDRLAAGQKIGALSPYALGLTWQLGQVGAEGEI
ncbi:MAG: hypothetical protein A2Z20_12050 [Bdellovibrionales bacterium RBG_16_40_8]|nr:MAG: hypothetical protein A2Z20_12050 [Bdellovibrionales bacterium RBG_16_40_8]